MKSYKALYADQSKHTAKERFPPKEGNIKAQAKVHHTLLKISACLANLIQLKHPLQAKL